MKFTQFIIYLVFVISLSILGILSFLSLNRYSAYVRFSTEVEKTHRIITRIENLESLLKDAETGNRGFLLSGDSSFLTPFLKADSVFHDKYLQLRSMLSDNEDQQRRIRYLRVLVDDKLATMAEARRTYLAAKKVTIENLLRSKSRMDECRLIFAEMRGAEEKLLAQRSRGKFLYETTAPRYMTRLFIFCGLAFIVSCAVIVREFKSKKTYQQELELRLMELKQSHAELEQIAYIASHDLQEPLRKISTFSDRLLIKHGPYLNEEGKNVVSRINYSATRMRGMVEDLANYINLIQLNEMMQPVRLKNILKEITEDEESAINKRQAQISWNNIPELRGYPKQIRLLFKALIDNSIKFSKPDVTPVIHIYGHLATHEELEFYRIKLEMTKYVKIVLRDNGIGFDNEFAGRMFKIFQRLHNQYSEYAGKGIGLATVKRVVANHKGFVFAKGTPMEGAEFTLFLPAART